MNTKVLIALTLLIVALSVGVFLKQNQDTRPPLTQQVTLHPLVPAGTDTTQVTRLIFFAGAQPRQRTIMARKDDQWRMQTYFNALLHPDRPNRILEAAVDFKGEFRAEVTDEQLADYDLSNERAFHVVGMVDDQPEAVFHFLAGKSPSPGNRFMRGADSNTVYLVNHNIRQGAYLTSEDFDEVPTPDPWLDKRIINQPEASFHKIELVMPDKTLTLEKHTDENTSESTWLMTRGGHGKALNPDALKAFEKTLSTLYAITILDPNKTEIWGLDDPQYHLVAHRETGETIELRVAHPTRFGPAYLQRLDNENQSLYAITGPNFFKLFMTGGELFNLKGLGIDEHVLNSIAYTTPEESIELKRVGEQWQFVHPASADPPIQKKVLKIIRTLAAWTPSDYADASTPNGLVDPQYTLTLNTDATQYTLALGQPSLHIPGRYAQVGTTDIPFVMSNNDLRAIFLSKEDLCTEDSEDPNEEKTLHLEMPSLDTGHHH